jgi:GR25 family glycosyltransferase involved in LPS biosynthesis
MEHLPIFCINVKDAKHRAERMKKRFESQKLTVVFWEAATPETLGALPYAHYINNGQRACAKSHYDLWVYQVEKHLPCVLIFEDDAVLRHDFCKVLDEKLALIDSHDPKWDMLLLNASEETEPLESWVHANNQCLTAGYVLSLRGAEELVRIGKSTLYASDWMTQMLQRRNHSYTFFPWLVIQDGKDSLIRGNVPTAEWEKVVRLLSAAKYELSNYDFQE